LNRIVFTLCVWLFPAACTALGAAGVFLLRRQTRPATRRILCGMAAGIMLAASVWSLLLPAIARSEGRAAWVPPALGLILGAVGLLRLEDAAGQLLAGGPGHCGRMVLAVTLHNLPEGMVVGLAAALALHGDADAVSGALALSLGIGLQGGGQSAADPERAHPGAVLCRRGGLRTGGAPGRGAGLCAGRVGRRSAAVAHERGGGLYGVCDRTGDDP
jgi:ZIP family zinc transporter